MENTELLNLTADIVSAHVGHNSVAVSGLASLVQQVHAALSGLITPDPPDEPEAKQAVVSVRASIKPDYLICMECGAKQKTLKRHLSSAHKMTPAQYRADYGLPNDYPMTSANYSQQRGEMARAIGLGRKPAQAKSAEAKPEVGTRTKGGPKKAASSKGLPALGNVPAEGDDQASSAG